MNNINLEDYHLQLTGKLSDDINNRYIILLKNLLEFYNKDNNLDEMLSIINGESPISLRIVDWFVTNYAKQKFTVYANFDRSFRLENPEK